MGGQAKSSAKFVSYDLRPAKQSERSILVDILKIAGDSGLSVRDYRYVGMGANRFYDFLLLHKYIGLKDMLSLEHDAHMYERAIFNVPYRFIEVRNTSIVDFMAVDKCESPEILWLDYDGGLGPDIAQDITSAATRLKLGDFCFVTVAGSPPKLMNKKNDQERLASVKEVMKELAGDVDLADVEVAMFSIAVHKILVAAFKNAFAVRRDGRFVFLLQVVYSDSIPMVTVGGALLDDDRATACLDRMKRALPFLPAGEVGLYRIRSFHLTERERHLFDRAATNKRKKCIERNLLLKMGFEEKDFEAYADLIRYLPRYVETVV